MNANRYFCTVHFRIKAVRYLPTLAYVVSSYTELIQNIQGLVGELYEALYIFMLVQTGFWIHRIFNILTTGRFSTNEPPHISRGWTNFTCLSWHDTFVLSKQITFKFFCVCIYAHRLACCLCQSHFLLFSFRYQGVELFCKNLTNLYCIPDPTYWSFCFAYNFYSCEIQIEHLWVPVCRIF